MKFYKNCWLPIHLPNAYQWAKCWYSSWGCSSEQNGYNSCPCRTYVLLRKQMLIQWKLIEFKIVSRSMVKNKRYQRHQSLKLILVLNRSFWEGLKMTWRINKSWRVSWRDACSRHVATEYEVSEEGKNWKNWGMERGDGWSMVSCGRKVYWDKFRGMERGQQGARPMLPFKNYRFYPTVHAHTHHITHITDWSFFF